jgi:undecaprenyl-diphosphatase
MREIRLSGSGEGAVLSRPYFINGSLTMEISSLQMPGPPKIGGASSRARGFVAGMFAPDMVCFWWESWLVFFPMTRLRELLNSAGWREFVLLLSVGTLLGGILVFVGVTDLVLEGDLHETEIRWMRDLRSPDDLARPIGPAWLENVSREVTVLGGGVVLTLITLVVAGYLLIERGYASTLLLFVAVAGGTLLTNVLKGYFDRDRPTVVPHLADSLFKSYPSGHSMMSSVVYLTLAVLLARAMERRRVKVYCVIVALLLSLLVGASRVYLGVHYPTDVIGGWAAGTAWALLCWLAANWLEKRGKVEPQRK